MSVMLALLLQIEKVRLIGERQHRGEVWCLAVSADGRKIVSGDDEGILKLWDGSGKELASWTGHRNAVTSVAFSPDGKRILSAGRDIALRLWDESGKELATWRGHGDWITAVATDGKRAVSGSCDNTVRLWDVETGEELAVWKGHQSWVTAVAFAGKYVLSASWDETVRRWDDTGKSVVWKGHHDVVTSIATDGKIAVTGSADKTVRTWDVESGREISSTPQPDIVFAVAFDGRRIAAAAGSVARIDGKEVAAHDGAVTCLAFLPDGRLVSGSRDHSIRVGERRGQGPITGLAFDGSHVISSARDGVRVWDIEGRLLATWSVNATCLAVDGNRAAIGSEDGTVGVWDVEKGVCLSKWKAHEGGTTCVAIEGKRVLSGGKDHRVVLHDEKEIAWEAHQDWVAAVAFGPDGQILSAGIDWILALWDAKGESIGRWQTGGTPSSLRVSGGRALCAGYGGDVRILDIAKHEIEVAWTATTLRARDAIFVGDLVVTANQEGRLQLWEGVAEVGRIEADGGPAHLAAHGDLLLAGNDDGTVAVYRRK